MRQAFERIMNAITFAEAGEPETAQSLLLREGNESAEKVKTEARSVAMADRADRYMQAITFAEEGEHEYARQTLGQIAPSARQAAAKSILVLGNEDTFAHYMVDYAVDMAERFQYEIIAVNALPLSRKTRLLHGFAEEIGERFQRNARNAGNAFKSKAEERGIPFHHEIRLMSEQKAIRHLHKERGNIEFVLTEPERLSADQAPECEGSVCVCALVQ